MSAQVESQAESRDSIGVPEESMPCRIDDDELGVNRVNAASRGSRQAKAACVGWLPRVPRKRPRVMAEDDGWDGRPEIDLLRATTVPTFEWTTEQISNQCGRVHAKLWIVNSIVSHRRIRP
jgi:hypothetical protein